MGVTFLERFWSRVTVTEDCWLWTGAVSGDGYPRVRVRGNMAPAHVVAWELVNGVPFPAGYDGHHVCEVRACVRPHSQHVVPKEPEGHRGYIWKQRRNAKKKG